MELYINSLNMIQLQRDLFSLTGARVNLYDANFRLISFYPPPCVHTPFCQRVRCTPDGFLRCSESDLHAFSIAKQEKHAYIYHCHAGLMEAVVPFIYNGEIICYMLLGQFLDGSKSQEENLCLVCDCCAGILSREEVQELLANQAALTTDQVESCFRLMDTIISLQQMIIPQKDPVFEQVYAYIMDHLAEPIGAQLLSEKMKLSTQKIRKTVQQNAGQSIGNYIQMLRLDRARDLLKNTELTISEVAEAVGIPDYNYFSRSFKKVNGITPSGFRKSIAKHT